MGFGADSSSAEAIVGLLAFCNAGQLFLTEDQSVGSLLQAARGQASVAADQQQPREDDASANPHHRRTSTRSHAGLRHAVN